MAKRSATECAALLDVCHCSDLIEQDKFEKGYGLLIRTKNNRARSRAQARARKIRFCIGAHDRKTGKSENIWAGKERFNGRL